MFTQHTPILIHPPHQHTIHPLRLLRYPRRHISPKPTPRTPAPLPRVRIHQPEIVRDPRSLAQIIRIIRRHRYALYCPARRVQIHLDIRPTVVRRPLQVVAGASRHRRIRGVPGGFEDRDDGAVVHDEIAPDLLESVDEVRRRCRCVNGEICGEIGTVVPWRHGILVLPALFAESGECFGKPVAGAGICDFAVEVEGALFLTCCEFRLV